MQVEFDPITNQTNAFFYQINLIFCYSMNKNLLNVIISVGQDILCSQKHLSISYLIILPTANQATGKGHKEEREVGNH